MPLTRYLILDDVGSGPRSSVVIGCTKAASNEAALKNAIRFSESVGAISIRMRVERLSAMKRTFSYEISCFWAKDSQFGVIYKCQVCLRVERGLGRHNHWDYCPLYQERKRRRP